MEKLTHMLFAFWWMYYLLYVAYDPGSYILGAILLVWSLYNTDKREQV